MFQRLKFLKEKFNFNPKVIYDIGAYEGNWTLEAKKIFPNAEYYLFEANNDKKECIEENIKNPNVYYEVLYHTTKEVTYYKSLLECQTGNSIFRENTQHFNDLYCETEVRKTKTLTSILEENKLPCPNLLKIDTQGSELIILKGFEKYWPTVDVILLEISLHKYNADAPLLNEVISYLAAKKYVMFDIVDLHYSSGVLIQIDALFCPLDSRFLLSKI